MMSEPSPIDAAKKTLRARMLRQRREFPEEERRAASEEIFRRVREEQSYRKARCVMAYASMEGEVELAPLMEDCIARGVRLALPWIRGKGIMEAALLPSMDALEAGAYGIPTVREDIRQIISPEDIDCVIVPGAAFSRKGERLGMGGGYYDRFLPRAQHAVRVALAFSFQLVEHIPVEPHDALMDVIITEQERIFNERT